MLELSTSPTSYCTQQTTASCSKLRLGLSSTAVLHIQVVRFGLLFNAGQCCAAGTRIYIHAAIYDEFVKALVKSFEEWCEALSSC